jgi:hypothetical protein
MEFCKGDRVRCLGRPDWGPGRVLKNSRNGKVTVCFDYAGEKLLLLEYAKIFKVSMPSQAPSLNTQQQASHAGLTPH